MAVKLRVRVTVMVSIRIYGRQNVVVYARMQSAAVVERHTPPRTMLDLRYDFILQKYCTRQR